MSDVRELVREIHGAPGLVCLAVTGAGTQAIAWIFAEPGASRTVLDARVPYSQRALDEFTGIASEQHVSAAEAQLMADRALQEAKELNPGDGLLAGIGCTAAIATDRERRGENRCHVAFAASDGRRNVYSLVLNKGERNRAGEEGVVSRMILNAVAEAKLVATRAELQLLPGESIVTSQNRGGDVD